MIKITRELFTSPLAIFIMYIIASGLAIMGFRLLFPGDIPLAYFSLSWRLIRGFLEYINLFPALVLTSLVIPFGFVIHTHEKNKAFSPQFFMSFKMSIITAIVASTLYGILFTLALPMAKNYEANLLYQSRLFHLAKERAQRSAADGDWTEVIQLLTICDRIWPDSPEIEELKIEAGIRIESASLHRSPAPDTEVLNWPETHQTITVTDALDMAEIALTERRYFDAHWLATLGSRLARPNSPEVATATRLAARAWNGINSMTPNTLETRAFNNFRLKREGFEAMLGDEWIHAYYIFLELSNLTPDDPDVIRYLALSEEGIKRSAFFIDEIELSLGQILTGAIFSLPLE